MYLNQYSQSVLTVDDAVELLYSGKGLDGVILESSTDVEEFNKSGISDVIVKNIDDSLSVEEFHGSRINSWLMPDAFYTLDMCEYLHALCDTDIERQRVDSELVLYVERGLIPMLQFMVYFVTTLREKEVLWGVGRGSSVASYVLFLIGVHRIDSILYDLDINEFLKG